MYACGCQYREYGYFTLIKCNCDLQQMSDSCRCCQLTIVRNTVRDTHNNYLEHKGL